MYEVVVETSFAARGSECRVLVAVASSELAEDVVVDFHALRNETDRLLARLPCGLTATALARLLFSELEPVVPGLEGAPDRRLCRVEVWDSPSSGASYAADLSP